MENEEHKEKHKEEENKDSDNAQSDEKVSGDKVKEHKEEIKESSDLIVNKTEVKKEKPKKEFNFSKNYDKNYKILLVIPIILLIIALFYLGTFQAQHGDIILKDITLSGGTSVQVNTDQNIEELRSQLEDNFEEINVRSISNVFTGEQIAIVVETTAELDEIRDFLEDYFGFELTSENSSIEFTGSTLSDSFYNQLRLAILFSFIFMAVIVFIIFRSFVPSIAVVFSAFADIVLTLSVVNLLGMRVSTAGIVAFLMLIGYSVDTDILLTTRTIKRREGTINSRILSSFKTGITMTLTSLLVVLIGLFLTSSFSKVFSQIFTILTIGLLFDIINTWFFNAGILKWYAEKTE